MKIGILSDSHGKKARLIAAMKTLAERRVEAIVHCGDVGSARCVRMLGSNSRGAYLVAGNMDRDVEELCVAAEESGVHFSGEVIEVPIGSGRYLVATHGHDEDILGELVAEQQFPYVCHGHTHRIRDQRIGKARVINPGALCHPRDPRYPTVAVLDTEADALEYIPLPH